MIMLITLSTIVVIINYYNHVGLQYLEHQAQHHSHFNIKHYAETVSYNVNGFLEKNRDTMTQDLLKLIAGSDSEFIRGSFNFYT